MRIGWNTSLIRAIGESGYSLEDIAYLTGVREPDLYEIMRNEAEAGEITKLKLSVITGKEPVELFPSNGNHS